MARREQELIVRAQGQSGDGLGIAREGRANRGVRRADELDLVVAGAGDEFAVGGDGEGAAAVELLEGGDTAVVLLQRLR